MVARRCKQKWCRDTVTGGYDAGDTVQEGLSNVHELDCSLLSDYRAA